MPSAVMAVPKPVRPLTMPPASAPARRMAICSGPMIATFADGQEELCRGKVAGVIARTQRRGGTDELATAAANVAVGEPFDGCGVVSKTASRGSTHARDPHPKLRFQPRFRRR